MAVTETAFDDLQLEPPAGPPTRLLYVAGVVLVAAAALTPFRSVPLRLTAYMLAALVASVIIGAFRYIDSRRKVRANYRILGWPSPTAAALLAIGWLLSCANVWLLATTWAR